MQNTVTAVGNTSVGENMLGQDSRAYAQLGHGPTHLSLLSTKLLLLLLPSFLWCWRWDSGQSFYHAQQIFYH